jgi:hypothetical protein
MEPSPKIDKHKGECIETYVKNMTQIAQHLTDVKALLRDCNEKYQAKVDEKARVLAASNASLVGGQEGEQHKLNLIVEGLSFDD